MIRALNMMVMLNHLRTGFMGWKEPYLMKRLSGLPASGKIGFKNWWLQCQEDLRLVLENIFATKERG